MHEKCPEPEKKYFSQNVASKLVRDVLGQTVGSVLNPSTTTGRLDIRIIVVPLIYTISLMLSFSENSADNVHLLKCVQQPHHVSE